MTQTYVADTHALVWHLFNPTRLSNMARDAFAKIARGEAVLNIPLIVVAETLMVVEKGRVKATYAHIETFLRQVARSSNYRIGGLDLQTILSAMRLIQVNDIFDRLIVAETHALGGSLITCDREIVAARLVPIVW